jgi:hypothetical protein
MASETFKRSHLSQSEEAQFRSEKLKAAYARITTQLTHNTEHYFQERGHPVFFIVRIFHRPYSSIIQSIVQLNNRRIGIYIKFSHVDRNSELEYERILKNTTREAEVTKEFSVFFSNEQSISVPELIAFFPDELAIVTKEKEGLPLMSLIVQSGKGKPDTKNLDLLRKGCYLLGNALKIFQEKPLINTGKDELPANLIAYVDLRLKLLLKSGFIQIQERLDVIHYLEKQLEIVNGQVLKRCGIHGDLSFGNILISSDQVVLLDLGMYRKGSPTFDPSYICKHLDAFLTNPFFFSSTITALQDAFFDGYQKKFSRRDPLFLSYYILNAVNHLLSLSRMSHLSILKKTYQKRQYRQYLSRLNKLIQEN